MTLKKSRIVGQFMALKHHEWERWSRPTPRDIDERYARESEASRQQKAEDVLDTNTLVSEN